VFIELTALARLACKYSTGPDAPKRALGLQCPCDIITVCLLQNHLSTGLPYHYGTCWELAAAYPQAKSSHMPARGLGPHTTIRTAGTPQQCPQLLQKLWYGF